MSIPRACLNGCTDECIAIWDERVRELKDGWSRRAQRQREARQRRNHEEANVMGAGRRGSLVRLGDMLGGFGDRAENTEGVIGQ